MPSETVHTKTVSEAGHHRDNEGGSHYAGTHT